VYELPADCRVLLEVYDAAGKKVATLVDGPRRAGKSVVRWDGRNGEGNRLASGVYFYRLRVAGDTITRKMVLLK
jgi:flagellar hook assembly protein FlgD